MDPLTLGAVAALAIFLFKGGKSKKKGPTTTGEKPVPGTDDPTGPTEPPPPKPSSKLKNYVGSGYDWPNKTRFPNEASFAMTLNVWGYSASVTKSMISEQNMIAVRKFQRDFNVVRKTVNEPPPGLLEDGLIGAGTIKGMLTVEAWVNFSGKPWPTMVAEAKAKA